MTTPVTIVPCKNCENTMLALQAAQERIKQLEAALAEARRNHPFAGGFK